MSQFAGEFQDPYSGTEYAGPRKTSGLAVAALVSSLILCCPLTTVLGVILGAVAVATIGRETPRKGRGIAIAAILLGLIFTAAQVGVGIWFWNTFVLPVLHGPRSALTAGFAGDIAGFKSGFYGAGATATDAEAQAFIDELRQRHGEFVAVKFDDQSGQQPRGTPGQAEAPFPYVLTFDKRTVKCTTVIIFADQQTGHMVFKLGSITVHDPEKGDLTYPPEGGGAGGNATPNRTPGSR